MRETTITTSELELPAPDSEIDRRVLTDVHAHGWHSIHVPPDHHSSGWAFTVGLFHTFGHPEVAIFGLAADVMHTVLNDLGEDVRAGNRYEPDVECQDLLPGATCALKLARPDWHTTFFGYALWFYRGREVPILQCVWTDSSQRYPWDPEFRRDWREQQPLLFLESIDRARVGPWLRSMAP